MARLTQFGETHGNPTPGRGNAGDSPGIIGAIQRLRKAMPTGRVKLWLWDLWHGVDTGGVVAVAAPDGVQYEATTPQEFRSLMRCLGPGQIRQSTFIDIGSGKGRVLLMAAAYPFRKIIGVEYSPELHERARRNIQSYRGRRHCRDITSMHADARAYQVPSGPLVLFFYNPFHLPVMLQVVENLRLALQAEPRDMAILCVSQWTQTVPIETLPGIRTESRGPAHAAYLIRYDHPA